ncbi:MAG: hypothetical protein ACE145_14280 [Terriglobia bacterium]
MSTLFQWIHVTAAVIGVGGMGFVLVVLLPSARVLNPEQRDLFLKMVMLRFRWVSWSVILLLLGSGLYNIHLRAWEVPWGTYWKFLTLKILLALMVFVISLLLTLPLKSFERFRARRKDWLAAAFGLALAVILISAYLRI